MAITDVLSTAASALQSNARRVHAAANAIVNIPAATDLRLEQSADAGRGATNDAVRGNPVPPALQEQPPADLATEIVHIIDAHTAYRAAASLMRTGIEMIEESLLDRR